MISSIKEEYALRGTQQFDVTDIITQHVRKGTKLGPTLESMSGACAFSYKYFDDLDKHALIYYFYPNLLSYLWGFQSEIRIVVEENDGLITGVRGFVFYHAL